MFRTLNLQAVTDALARAGLNQARLAAQLGVSREAVSNWFSGESFPLPDKLLRLGMALGLKFEELVVSPVPQAVPIVSFRRKPARKTRDVHLDDARETGELLKRLVKYLPDPQLTTAPVLKEPRCDYDYVQKVASDVRKEMGLERKPVIEFKDVIDKFNQLHAVIVPVLWGAQDHHGNALNIHLPDSGITWVFLNLDSNAIDFKFWMAHELGHALAPTFGGESGEDFADAFAQALLFPESHAVCVRSEILPLGTVGSRVNAIKDVATRHLISPYTIRRAIETYEEAKGMDSVNLGELPVFMGAVKNLSKGYRTLTQVLFRTMPPEPSDYAAAGRKPFNSQFFEALAAFCRAEEGSTPFIHQVLGLPLADAKALSRELRK